MTRTFARVASPLGELVLEASGEKLAAVYFPTSRHASPPTDGPDWVEDDGRGRAAELLDRARGQLAEYFAGSRTTFDLPLGAVGTPFQRRVWDALLAVPYGTTVSYSELACRLGDQRATRAVGAANGRNPIPIIVPCHRVVGAHGALTGFGGGLDRKRWLLEHEGALLPLEQ
ncbi:MAG TPA: methylated-DNA--[protein]-cysteine S-methyltransferase [Gemmatimonadales bacterium]|nr:methylated-DNA--[protein]-cysteine S-methyltransferase [Gemmatimonadales bacterium]